MKNALNKLLGFLFRGLKPSYYKEILLPYKLEMREALKEDVSNANGLLMHQVLQSNQKVDRVLDLLTISMDVSKLPKAIGVRRDFQISMLILLDKFDKLCKKHNLTYWLDFGTMLGAVRHQGFIPWDDDLDVGMMIGDYKKLLEIDSSELLEFGMTSPEGFTGVFKKLVLKELTEDTIMGIDIFPYYYEGIDHNYKSNLLTRINSCIKEINEYETVENENILKLSKKYKINQDNSEKFDKSKIIYLGTSCVLYKQELFTYEDIYPLDEVLFEDKTYKIPNNYYKFLFSRYSNFYLLPNNIKLDSERHSNHLDLTNQAFANKLKNIVKDYQ